MKKTTILKTMLLGLVLMTGIVSATAKTVLTFSGLVESSTSVTITDGTVTAPDALQTVMNGYTVTYANSMTLEAAGWKLSTANKDFIIDGFTAGDVVTVNLSANRLTTNGTKCSDIATWTTVAQSGKTSTAMTLTGTKLNLYTKDGAVVIKSIEIMSAAEAADLESISKPAISCKDGKVTITPGESSKGNSVTTYYTTDNTTPSATNGTAYTAPFTVDAPTVVRAVTLNGAATSETVAAVCSPDAPRAKSLDLTAINTGDNVTLTTTGVTAASYRYAYNYLTDFYGTLAFDNPARWTIGTGGLTSTAANDIFEIPNLKEGDQVTFTITTGRLQLYGQSTSNHLVNSATPADGYTNVAKAGEDGYTYTVTMLSDANLKVCTKESAVNITAITVTEKEEEHYDMPAVRTPAPQNRALWACQTSDGSKTFVSWRARKNDTEATYYNLYRNGTLYGTYTDVTNITIDGTASTYTTDTYRLETVSGGVADESREMNIAAGGVKPHSWLRIKLADEPAVTNTGVMWNKEGVDDGYAVRYTPNDMSCCDMDGDGQEELIVKWDPSNSQDNGYSGYTANVYIDCYKMDWTSAEPTATLMWRINLGQNIRAGAHYTMFLCYDFDGDGKGEMICKTSLGTKDGQGNYVFQSRITERNLDVTREYTRTDDSGTAQKSNGHIGVGEEWLTVFNGTTGAEMATIDFYPKFNVVSSWNEPSGSSNKYNKGTRFKACVAFLDGKNPSAVYNRGYYSQSFFTAYNWNGEHLYEVWRHASTTPGEGLYGQGNHSLVVGDMDGDGNDEIGTGPAVLDNDGSILWTSGFGHGDAHHLGDFDPENEGMEIFYVNEEYGESDYSTALFDAKTGRILQGHTQFGMDTGRGLALDMSAKHAGAELFSKGDSDKQGETHLVQYVDGTRDWLGGSGDYGWRNGSLVKGFTITDEQGQTVTNDVNSYPNFRIYWDGDLLDEWMDSRHVDKLNDETNLFKRIYTFDSPSHRARSINGTKENPNLQTDLFGDWREEAIFYDYDVTGTTTKTVSSKSINDGAEFDYEWENRQYYLVVFTTTIPTEHKLPWLRDDHVYDMSIAWQNIGYNQPPHLGYSPLEVYGKGGSTVGMVRTVAVQEPDAVCYSLQGIRVDKPRKGIYIINNKKIVVK
ncbi:MAG: chitobiase/beta-hexosaminidase C-terminal domain-containing protein [Prevotella sp.]|nr:chitobiase/beta-hexosaminidase C-terminal domain-containing protein [Prevotella sp.]